MPARRADQPVAYSHLVGREVSISSEAWKHECEIAAITAMPIAKRNTFLDGVQGSTDREERGVKGVRGEAAVAALRAEVERYADILRRLP
ncbi:hypothetical protein [Bosea sp. 124]|uniref:DUF7696 family protein n=1 Tax=Bosea sp. 124 TaxID=2135642 RepID=UPI000D3A6227|nr:hypothetical protein [Bosea sp. 124]PTM39476.1 hypothetical protein C8D03_0972 [Bosea sp. 124]